MVTKSPRRLASPYAATAAGPVLMLRIIGSNPVEYRGGAPAPDMINKSLGRSGRAFGLLVKDDSPPWASRCAVISRSDLRPMTCESQNGAHAAIAGAMT